MNEHQLTPPVKHADQEALIDQLVGPLPEPVIAVLHCADCGDRIPEGAKRACVRSGYHVTHGQSGEICESCFWHRKAEGSGRR